jgi:hypothetical protein
MPTECPPGAGYRGKDTRRYRWEEKAHLPVRKKRPKQVTLNSSN